MPNFVELRVATSNLIHTLSVEDTRKAIHKLIQKQAPAIIGLQEFGYAERINILDHDLLRHYSIYLNTADSFTRQNPIMWLTGRFSLIEGRTVKLTRTPFFRKGATKPIDSYGTYVKLYDRYTRRMTHVLNVHCPPSIQIPNGQFSTLKNRTDAYKQILKKGKRFLLKRTGKQDVVTMTMDSNWDVSKRHVGSPQYFLYPEFKDSYTLAPHGPTLPRRIVDYVFWRHVNFIKGVTTALTPVGSDHKAVTVKLEVKKL